MTDLVTPRRALLSVSDKTGLVDLARELAQREIELVSTGGTARALAGAGLAVTDVADITGFPEMMGGRVKTLHPFIHGGILARRDVPEHLGAMEAFDMVPIDLVVVNLYPFESAVARGADPAACIEEIDVGGPALLRAAAKNQEHVAVVTDLEDYPALLAELRVHGGTTRAFRQRLALTAFGRTAAYDAAIAGWLAGALAEPAPRRRAFSGRLGQVLRYGENPHQRGAFYRDGSGRPGVATARQVGGKALSYNNLHDADAAWELAADLPADRAACAIVKHANPCGVALGATPAEAHARAFDCDRVSAFGGVVALNRPLDRAAAEAITGIFTEVVLAPDADEGALAVFAARPNLRLLLGPLPDPEAARLAVRQVAGGWLVQDADVKPLGPAGLTVVTRRQPTEAEWADLAFAWRVAKHVKSNAIVYARGATTVGIGAGQMSRLDSTRIAARKAVDMAAALGLDEPATRGSVVASDAFFPFADGLIAAAEAGATAAIQPGGSVRDAEVVAAADALGLAMVFTGRRHFRH